MMGVLARRHDSNYPFNKFYYSIIQKYRRGLGLVTETNITKTNSNISIIDNNLDQIK